MQTWRDEPTDENLHALMSRAREWRAANERGAEDVRKTHGSVDQRRFQAQVRERIRGALRLDEGGGDVPSDDVLVHGMYDLLDRYEQVFPSRGFTLDEMVARHREREANPERNSWLVDGLLRAGGLSVISSDPKCGKSCLARCLAVAVAGGKDAFLGRRIANGPAIFVELDEPEESAAEHYAQIWIEGAELAQYQNYGGAKLAQPRFGWLSEWATDIGAVLIIIDTMARFEPLGGDNAISDYGAMTALMAKFQTLAASTGAHVMLLHHVAKGLSNRSPLGSQAIGGAVDTMLMLSKDPDGVRHFQADGRGVAVPKTRLDFEDGWISAGATAKAEAARDKRAALLAVIEASPGELSRTEAVKRAGVRKDEGLRLIEVMEREGYVRSGPRAGKRGLTLWPTES